MKIIINGAGGRMGKALRAMAEKGCRNAELAAMVDPYVNEEGMLDSLTAFEGNADCIIDFSNHAGTAELVAYAAAKKLPVVIATTGHTEEELAIPRSEITLLGQSDFICGQRGFLLQPVLGLISPAGMADMTPSPAEVAETFTVPLEFFQTTAPALYTYELAPKVPADFPYEAVGIPRDYPWAKGAVDVPIWYWENHVIWGLTARIVQDITAQSCS